MFVGSAAKGWVTAVAKLCALRAELTRHADSKEQVVEAYII